MRFGLQILGALSGGDTPGRLGWVAAYRMEWAPLAAGCAVLHLCEDLRNCHASPVEATRGKDFVQSDTQEGLRTLETVSGGSFTYRLYDTADGARGGHVHLYSPQNTKAVTRPLARRSGRHPTDQLLP